MRWPEETAFRTLLRKKITLKATNERLERIAEMAIVAENAGFAKHVAALVLKAMREMKPDYKLRVLYALSSIARVSFEKFGSRSQYSKLWGSQLEVLGDILQHVPVEDKAYIARVLKLWWREGLFHPVKISRLQDIFVEKTEGSSTSPPQPHSVPQTLLKTPVDHWTALGVQVVMEERMYGIPDTPASPISSYAVPFQYREEIRAAAHSSTTAFTPL